MKERVQKTNQAQRQLDWFNVCQRERQIQVSKNIINIILVHISYPILYFAIRSVFPPLVFIAFILVYKTNKK